MSNQARCSVLAIAYFLSCLYMLPVCFGCATTSGGTQQLTPIQAVLGNDIRAEPLTSGSQQRVIESPRDLNCNTWGAICRWRNVDGDNLDWQRGLGFADSSLLQQQVGTRVAPDPPFAITYPGRALSSTFNAFLVSDPVPCQQSNGELAFKYWSSSNAYLRVCARNLGASSPDFCSPPVRRGNGFAVFATIPGPRFSPFEIVIEASSFLSATDFVIIDDLEFSNVFCRSRDSDVSQNRQITDEQRGNSGETGGRTSRTEPPPRPAVVGPSSAGTDSTACNALNCKFNEGSLCAQSAEQPDSTWSLARGFTGNRNTGIPGDPLDRERGTYAFTTGPTLPNGSRLTLPRVSLSEGRQLKFQFYKASYGSQFEVLRNGQRVLFEDENSSLRDWRTGTVDLGPGRDQQIEFVARNLGPNHYVAIDELMLVSSRGERVCS